jgi:hypothetical protein
MPITPSLMRLKYENSKYQASLGYITRHCLKNKQTKLNQGQKTRAKVKKKAHDKTHDGLPSSEIYLDL